MSAELIRIRGTVQGVGFRPTVARIARNRGLDGFVKNDGDGVVIGVRGAKAERQAFIDQLLSQLPTLAEVDSMERSATEGSWAPGFRIEASDAGASRTEVAPDAATCPACLAEVMSPYERRFRYPFATCTECGPRFTIARSIPFDREATTMSAFPLCSACQVEYDDEGDRRYHAQAVACHTCGPKAWVERSDGRPFTFERYSMTDSVDATASLLQEGYIVAIKGVGGFHLCCDATQPQVVERLRERKRRYGKPFALMARDLDVVRAYAHVSSEEEAALCSPAAPIVLLERREDQPLPESVAPSQRTLGFMLPYSPLHHLALRRMSRPIVCTSGNRSEEPQCIDEEEARARLGQIADWFVLHDRPIRNRVDDSVVRIMAGELRTLRRARGYAPKPVSLPPGFEGAPSLLAMGGQFKATFALSDDRRVGVSPHLGDLDDLRAFEAYGDTLDLLQRLYEHQPRAVAVDAHPEYRATQMGRNLARARSLPCIDVHHHHAHVAAVMADQGLARTSGPVLGIALDGAGLGPDHRIWGGEFLRATYAGFERVGTFKPVALLGGDAAAQQPWRNLYAHLRAEMSWAQLLTNFGDVPVVRRLHDERPRELLESLLNQPLHAPLASSCGRLFDAVAAAVGICEDSVSYEGQAAMELEARIDDQHLTQALAEERYPIGIPNLPDSKLPYLEFVGMWSAILGDVFAEVPVPLISARFHVALSEALVRMAEKQRSTAPELERVVLCGGCFQNRRLLELTHQGLQRVGFQVLLPRRFPANDGSIALGQAVVAAAALQAKGA